LKALEVWTRGRATEGVNGALSCRAVTLCCGLVVRGGCLRADSNCFSLANRSVSLVLPARVDEGVCAGIVLAVGGVVIPLTS
jgi:hypothetical protein